MPRNYLHNYYTYINSHYSQLDPDLNYFSMFIDVKIQYRWIQLLGIQSSNLAFKYGIVISCSIVFRFVLQIQPWDWNDDDVMKFVFLSLLNHGYNEV